MNSPTTTNRKSTIDCAHDTVSLKELDQPTGKTPIKTSISNPIITENENPQNTKHLLNQIKTTQSKNKSIIHKDV